MLRLETTLLFWIAVGSFQGTLGSKFYETSAPGPVSPCVPGISCIPGQTFPPAKPRLNSRPGKSAYENHSSKDPCISKFIDTFIAAVRSCQELSDLCGYFSHTNAIEFCRGIYPVILESINAVQAPNAEFASQQAVEAIAESFDTLTSDIVIQVYSKTIAKYLFTQELLTPQNAVQLAKQYVNTLKEAASCNDSQYAALGEGFVNFLNFLGLFTPDKVLLIALQFGNEWKLAANPRGNVRRLAGRG